MYERTIRPARVLPPDETAAYDRRRARGGRLIEARNHFPTTASPQAAAEAAGQRLVAALSAVGI